MSQDARFSSLSHDPRFMRPKKASTKLRIDSRFKGMLQSEAFGTGTAARVDKYGRPVKGSTASDLKKFYHLDEEDVEEKDSDSSENDDEEEKETSADESEQESFAGSEAASSGEDEKETAISGYALARGGGDIESSSEEDEDDEEEDEEDETSESEQVLGPDGAPLSINPLAQDNIPTGEETARLALVNMDWDNVRAVDLYKALDGLKPKGGIVHSITVYTSEFGKERLAHEQKHGPPPEIFKQTESKGSLIRAEDSEDVFDEDKLRKYQLERLRYYYAVAVLDSVETARALYETCDGAEFETTSNFFDMRYIPEGMEFDEADVKDQSMDGDAAALYAPREYVTNALQHSKVKLTWDDDDLDRKSVMRRKFTKDDLKNMDFKAYLASSSEEEDEEGQGADLEEKTKVYSALIRGSENVSDSDADQEMEITFTPGLVDRPEIDEKTSTAGDASNSKETVFESYLRKKKEKKKERKRLRKLQASGAASEGGKIDDALVSDPERLIDEDEDLNFDDPFFNASKPKTKKAKTSAHKSEAKTNDEEVATALRDKAELELLVMDDADTLNKHFSVQDVLKSEKEGKRKRKRNRKGANKDKALDLAEGIQESFQVDASDPRFQGLYQSHHFAIDPLNPQFKKTKAMEVILDARSKKAGGNTTHSQQSDKDASQDLRSNTTINSDDISGIVQRLKTNSR